MFRFKLNALGSTTLVGEVTASSMLNPRETEIPTYVISMIECSGRIVSFTVGFTVRSTSPGNMQGTGLTSNCRWSDTELLSAGHHKNRLIECFQRPKWYIA